MNSTSSREITQYDLYLHGAGSICRNCGKHDSEHTSQFVPMYGYRAMVCPIESVESVYVRQHATIAAAIELLQATLDDMANPEFCSILWGDVTEHAHVAAAANTLVESLTES